ncbi:MAG: RIP metalloprotease RseP [Clostridia bacterium]
MIAMILIILKLLIILCVVATIHEFGHFLMCKLFKVGVNEFSIGFGPKIFQKKIKETMYSLRWIPLGGYCAIEGEGEESNSSGSFNNVNVLKKILILCMGVVFNAILAVIIFVSIAFSVPTFNTKITGFVNDSITEQAGLKVGDTIYAIDGKKVNISADLIQRRINGKNVEVQYIRDGQMHKANVENAVTDIGYIGVSFNLSDDKKSVTNVVNMVASGGAAVKAGLKANDKILSINGISTPNSTSVIEIVKQNANKELEFLIDRKGEIVTKKVIPEIKAYFDLQIASTEKVKTNFKLAFISAWSNVKTIVGSYCDLFTGKVGFKDMSGIVGIGEVVSNTDGTRNFLNLIGIISLAIGVANIMPFPPLDGGKIVIVTIEAITRKKVPIKVESIISYIGFGLLLLLTIYVTFNDLIRIL